MKTLLIGGARSGKSSIASRWASERSAKVCCLVTGVGSDPEMVARIEAHRRDRPAHWRVREEPIHLGRALHEESHGDSAAARGSPSISCESQLILIDCLTLWIANCLWPASSAGDSPVAPDETLWRCERDEFMQTLRGCRADVLVVTNEIGCGIVPDNAAARIFRDEQGWLNQAVAQVCDEVFWVTAGLTLRLAPR